LSSNIFLSLDWKAVINVDCALTLVSLLGLNVLRTDEPKVALDHVQGATVDDISLEAVQVDNVFVAHHLTSLDVVEDGQLIGREVSLKLCVALRATGVLQLFDSGHDGVTLGVVDGRKGFETKVDGVGNFLLGELAVYICGTLDDCILLAKVEVGGKRLSVETHWVGNAQRHGRSLLRRCR
jgi:hypothetical protein